MNLGRIFAHAVARRLAVVLVALALAWLGIGSARAQHATQGLAYIACMNAAKAAVASNPNMRMPADIPCLHQPAQRRYECRYMRRPQTYLPYELETCAYPNYLPNATCANQSSQTVQITPKGGSTRCVEGCEVMYYPNGDGTSSGSQVGAACYPLEYPDNCPIDYYWNPIQWLCEPMTPECPPGQTLNSRQECAPEPCPAGMTLQADNTCAPSKDECPPGNVKAPSGECLPGEGQCAAGEARRPNGTCGKDADGDGQADEDDDDPENDPDKESASGGDTCDQPPSCSGSAIACMQVKIQWRIDCNTRKAANISGGACNAMPVCTGKSCDAMEYAQLIQQWKTTCALEKLGTGGGVGGADPNTAAIKEALTGSSQGDAGPEGSPGDGWQSGGEGEGEEYLPDGSGYGYGSSCPTMPPLSIYGTTINIDIGPLCQWVGLGGNIVFALAALASLRIVAGRAT